MIFIKHVISNRYRVSLPEFSNVEADAFIRLEPNKNMFVASFLNIDTGWFERFEKIIGEKDQAYKNRTDLSSEIKLPAGTEHIPGIRNNNTQLTNQIYKERNGLRHRLKFIKKINFTLN